jgi:hypothetical protein
MKLIALGWKPIIVMPTMLKDPEWIASFKTFFPPPPQFELPLGAPSPSHGSAL